jgi:hypothetical protein
MQKDGSFRHGPVDHQSDCNEDADRLRPPDCDPIAIRARLRRLNILNMVVDPVISFRERRSKRKNGHFVTPKPSVSGEGLDEVGRVCGEGLEDV